MREAVDRLRESFFDKVSTSRIMETGHRSIVVFDDRGKIIGILAIIDLFAGHYAGTSQCTQTVDGRQYSVFTDVLERNVRKGSHSAGPKKNQGRHVSRTLDHRCRCQSDGGRSHDDCKQ